MLCGNAEEQPILKEYFLQTAFLHFFHVVFIMQMKKNLYALKLIYSCSLVQL